MKDEVVTDNWSYKTCKAPVKSSPQTKLDNGLPGRERIDDIFSRLDTINQRDRRTDGHQPTAKAALTRSVAQ